MDVALAGNHCSSVKTRIVEIWVGREDIHETIDINVILANGVHVLSTF